MLNALDRTRYNRKDGVSLSILYFWPLIICQFCILGPSLLGRSFSTIYRRYDKPYSVILFLPLHNKTAPPLPVDVANLLVNHVNLLSCFSRLYFLVLSQIPNNKLISEPLD